MGHHGSMIRLVAVWRQLMDTGRVLDPLWLALDNGTRPSRVGGGEIDHGLPSCNQMPSAGLRSA
jgi:hypothetical protein